MPSKKTEKHGKKWTEKDINEIGVQAKSGRPTPKIAKDLGRTEGALRSKASEEGISLTPVDKK